MEFLGKTIFQNFFRRKFHFFPTFFRGKFPPKFSPEKNYEKSAPCHSANLKQSDQMGRFALWENVFFGQFIENSRNYLIFGLQ
jgi:hypothetical protein